MSEFKVGDIVKVDIPPTLYLPKSITGRGRIIKIKTEFRTEACSKSYDVNMISGPYSGMTFCFDESQLSKFETYDVFDFNKSKLFDDICSNSHTLYQQAMDAMNKYKFAIKEGKGVIEVKNKNVNIPEIDRVIFNNPATIIFWKAYHTEIQDDVGKTTGLPTEKYVRVQDKTVVKCAPGEKFNKYQGFCAAVAKYIFGTNSEVNRIVKNGIDDSSTKKPETADVKKTEVQTRECKYYSEKCGRKYTCKQVYDCDGKKEKKCLIYQKLEEEKKKGGSKK